MYHQQRITNVKMYHQQRIRDTRCITRRHLLVIRADTRHTLCTSVKNGKSKQLGDNTLTKLTAGGDLMRKSSSQNCVAKNAVTKTTCGGAHHLRNVLQSQTPMISVFSFGLRSLGVISNAGAPTALEAQNRRAQKLAHVRPHPRPCGSLRHQTACLHTAAPTVLARWSVIAW